jgi:hypothetical protein
MKLVNPEASVQNQPDRVNPHPRDLAGMTVVLYWNGKPNGDVFLNRVGELLLERFKNAKVIKAWEISPSTRYTDPNPEASKATARDLAGLSPDIVIGAPGDCAGSATWLVADHLNLERLGIPTVTVITSPFMEMAGTVPPSEGFHEACFVQVSPPIGMLPLSEIRAKAETVFDDILKAATDWNPSGGEAVKEPGRPFDVIEVSGTVEDVNRHFLKRGWSLGLPVLPPTPERVREMLSGTCRRPDEILGRVPPRLGTLTVELAAAYAVMAGCRPEYMPVLVAAMEGFLAPEANWRLALSGTGTSQLMVVVNGPIVRELSIGFEQGAAGKGHHANGSIGYAVNLIGYSVGGSRPPFIDRSTLGSPADYVCWVFGENEQALPAGWKPLHVERGFEVSDSVVTVMAGYPPIENMDHWSASVEEHMRWWSHIASPLQNMGGPSVPQVMQQSPILALGPEHARLIASAGMGKQDFCRAFWAATRIPLSAWPSACGRERLIEMLGPLTDDSLIPITVDPRQILVVVAGGDGKQSHYFAPLPGCFPVSKLVRH